MRAHDIVVVGGGLVGMAVAYGLLRRGFGVVVTDEGDAAYRAARGNFALVWVQGKGDGLPRYASWTRASADLWPAFADELEDRTGLDLEYSRRGGVSVCFSEEELSALQARLERVAREAIKRMSTRHGGQGGAAKQPWRFYVDLKSLVPCLFGQLIHRHGSGGLPGIIDQNVDTLTPIHELPPQTHNLVGPFEIRLEVAALAGTGRVQQLLNSLPVAPVVSSDYGAVFKQVGGHLKSDAATGAGHENTLALQSTSDFAGVPYVLPSPLLLL